MLTRQLFLDHWGSWKHLCFALVFGFAVLPADVSFAKRVALVIGNARYEHVSNIPNSANDANDIAAALRRIGFVVTAKKDLDYREMRLTLKDFSEEMADAEMALVYFAGHGIEIDNTNYLIPTNAELKSDKDVEFEAIRLDSVLSAVSTAKGLKLVIVDACRNNPFLTDMVRTNATRSIGQGLARVDPSGVLVGYSARGGTLALDGEGRNSPYATAFLEHVEVPGLELGKLFRKVRDTVYDLTDGYQEPFTYGSLPGHDIFLVPAVVDVPADVEDVSVDAALTVAINEREKLARRVLKEALKLEDEFAKQNALRLIAQLYPDTRAGDYSQQISDVVSQTNRKVAALVTPKTTVTTPAHKENQREASAHPPISNSGIETGLDLSRSDYRSIQRGLNTLGFSVGSVDGIFGPQSRAALRAFQSKNGAESTGFLTAESVAVLRNIAQPEGPSLAEPNARTQNVAAVSPRIDGPTARSIYGEYIIDIRRRADPLGGDADSGTDTMLRLIYRKTSDEFKLVSAVDRSKGGDSRSKNYRASLSDDGRLRLSGRTNYLFNSVIVVPFSISMSVPSNLATNTPIHSNQGRFDKNWFIDVVVTKK